MFYLIIGLCFALPIAALLVINLLYQFYVVSKSFVTDNKWAQKSELLAIWKVFYPKSWYEGQSGYDCFSNLDGEDTACAMFTSNLIILLTGIAFFLGWIVVAPVVGYIYLLHGMRFCFRTKTKLDNHMHDKDSGKATY